MRNNKARGSILVLAVWSLFLMAAFAVSLGYAVRQKATLLNRLDTLDALYPAAYSGVERAKALVKVKLGVPPDPFNTLSEAWASNPSLFRQVVLGSCSFSVSPPVSGGEPRYGLEDEESKVNLNKADAATLTKLFQVTAGLDDDEAGKAAYAVIDWRDKDPTYQHPTYGAEDGDYSQLRFSYGAKDGFFEAVDELLLVKGINRDIFDKIRFYVTPFGTGVVNVHTASAEVLQALGLSPVMLDKLLNYRRGPDREDGTADDRYFSEPGKIVSELKKVDDTMNLGEETELSNLIGQGKLGTASSVFMARSKAVYEKNGATLEMDAVVDRNGRVLYCKPSRIEWPTRA